MFESRPKLRTICDAAEYGIELPRLGVPGFPEEETAGALAQVAEAVEVVVGDHRSATIDDPETHAPQRRDLAHGSGLPRSRFRDTLPRISLHRSFRQTLHA